MPGLNGMDVLVLLWLAVMIVFIAVELATIGLTSIWFAAGAFVALIIAIAGGNFIAQVFFFFAVSIILLMATRPWAKKYINSRTQKTNVDRVVGEITRVTERVSNLDQTGRAVVLGQDWAVRTDDDNEIINQGELVEIIRVSGVKLIVKGIKEEKTCQEQD